MPKVVVLHAACQRQMCGWFHSALLLQQLYL